MKYKYYFQKPRSEIAKDIIKWLVVAGAVVIAANSPYFLINLMRGIGKFRKYKRRNITNTFQRLQRRGLLKIEKSNHQIYISLTEEGRKIAGWMQIDALKIKKPKKWDHYWRLVVFDISQLKRNYRDAFRGKLKELGFFPLQKSVWVHPFDCRDEINLLKDFFGLTDKEMRLILAKDIGPDDWLKKKFDI